MGKWTNCPLWGDEEKDAAVDKSAVKRFTVDKTAVDRTERMRFAVDEIRSGRDSQWTRCRSGWDSQWTGPQWTERIFYWTRFAVDEIPQWTGPQETLDDLILQWIQYCNKFFGCFISAVDTNTAVRLWLFYSCSGHKYCSGQEGITVDYAKYCSGLSITAVIRKW